jgi:hypothetical protein
MAVPRTVKVKRRCCRSSPRCKRCPVVAKRLEKAGLAERIGKRSYIVIASKREVARARRNKPLG